MKLLLQPSYSRLCGQTCLAMLANITLAHAIVLVEHEHGTRTKELIKAFRKLNWSCPDRLIVLRGTLLTTLEHALVKVIFPPSSRSHWIAVHGGTVFDPMPDSLALGRATSHLPLTKER